MSEPGKIRIGMSGWRYDEWRGTFYPEKLAQRRDSSLPRDSSTLSN